MSRAKALTRGDRRRNERLVRLRSIVRRDYAIVAVDLASAKQAAVVADHDSIVLGRRMFSGDAWVIDDITGLGRTDRCRSGIRGCGTRLRADRASVEAGAGPRTRT